MKYVYLFEEGNKTMKNLLGGKGANIAEMINIGLPVPKGFTVTTLACSKYYEDNNLVSVDIVNEIENNIKLLEEKTDKYFGSITNPLLVSVRSGSRASMPGMMDTILNLGMNDLVAEGLAIKTNNPRFSYDSYRRFIMMFADVVMGYSKDNFERVFMEYKNKRGYKLDTDLSALEMKEIAFKFKDIYKDLTKSEFPSNPNVQLIEAVKAVFRSWNNERAITYRRINDIPSSWGTAVNIQEMVYGNMGDDSGTGVAFTRNPATGENLLYGEYLMNAQGEDVVAGIRTPLPINTLKDTLPLVYEEFVKNAHILEDHYRDMQDMEFTIENGKLFMLQTRNGKRTATAALKIAVDLVNEKKITKEEALLMVDPKQLDQLLHPTFNKDSLSKAEIIAHGLAASPGASSGHIYFSTTDALKAKKMQVNDIILVRMETSPEDIEGMLLAKGILTVRGGMTSHAAVVARGMGTCCICGCNELNIDILNKTLTIKDKRVYHEGDLISLDGTTGIVYDGAIELDEATESENFKTFMEWADEVRDMEIRANADSKKDALIALKYKAEGIGLCRTEHMFFTEERIFKMRQMILAGNKKEREEALEKLLPLQKDDFIEIFRVMDNLPVTIRFLDPPLHEFLPQKEDEIEALAKELNIKTTDLVKKINSLKEFNPMMGHRGCRLSITYPEIALMQTAAVISAGLLVKEEGINITPEIMIPLVGDVKEFDYIKDIVTKKADELIKEAKSDLKYKIGTMMEIPRACLVADEIATSAAFFSFGTNDLTQMTFGFSRDDAGSFLNDYYKLSILESDPFERIDEKGVGKLIELGTTLGRSVNPNLKIGICGEHGGNPSSIEFCYKLGFNYVSCSPYRVPIARLAAAQAKLKNIKK